MCRCAAGALLTAAAGPSPRATFAFLIGAQALFGFGCGGEFPVAAASASERAESEAHLKGLRGRTTVLVFSMQARCRRPQRVVVQRHAEVCTNSSHPMWHSDAYQRILLSC